ncbi:MAG: MATE family efflux transporter [Eubacteriales bacterium]|nr:MATE family efflux transporter [Eubacteriales bacterium]
MNFKKKFIGDKAFYSMVLALAVPVMIQNGITNFVGLLDNIMVGQVGTEQMSGVAIANQLVFVFNLCIFGGVSGAGIFGAQFFGKGDSDGVRDILRIKLWLALVLSVAAGVVFTFWSEPLISLFLHEGSESGDLAATLLYGKQYLSLMRLLLVPFALVQAYASTLRETGETKLPMQAGVVAVLVNLVFNYLLIYGKLGFPVLGVQGAAIATILSRIVEAAIVIAWTHRNRERNPFAVGLYRTLRVPSALLGQVAVKGSPLLVNEALWSMAMTTLAQCYSLRGLAVVAAVNITSTITNLFNIVFMSLGSSIGIIVGNLLGAGRMREARDADNKLIAFSVASCLLVGAIMAVVAPLFPRLYNTTAEVRRLAGGMILISAAIMPFHAFTHATYFTLRSGGKTFVTFLFDSVFVWAVNVPIAFVLSRFTGLPILPLFAVCQSIEILKSFIGYFFVRSDVWMQNIVG